MSIPNSRAWYFISLRPAGQHASLRRATATYGGKVLAMSPLRIARRDDDEVRAQLTRALACDIVLWTSPNAVVIANALSALAGNDALHVAVGRGTQLALRKFGVQRTTAPARMDSEGLLALDALRNVRDRDLGLVTGEGGRGVIEAELMQRGARVHRANVYAREAMGLSANTLKRFDACHAGGARCFLALSSDEALQSLLAQLDPARRARLLALPVVVASARLAESAREAGFGMIIAAASARPADMVAAARKR